MSEEIVKNSVYEHQWWISVTPYDNEGSHSHRFYTKHDGSDVILMFEPEKSKYIPIRLQTEKIILLRDRIIEFNIENFFNYFPEIERDEYYCEDEYTTVCEFHLGDSRSLFCVRYFNLYIPIFVNQSLVELLSDKLLPLSKALSLCDNYAMNIEQNDVLMQNIMKNNSKDRKNINQNYIEMKNLAYKAIKEVLQEIQENM